MAVLCEIRGDHQRQFRLGQTTLLGRAPSCTIQLDDPLVSREHAEIRVTSAGTHEIIDMGSTHGTFVERERVSRHPLHDGQEIIIGATRLRFYSVEDVDELRRWDERVPCDVRVMVCLEDGERLETQATDLSLGGMGLELDRQLEPDTMVDLLVSFPGRFRRLRLRGRVTRCGAEKQGVGIAFIFGSQRSRKNLAQEYAGLLRSQQP